MANPEDLGGFAATRTSLQGSGERIIVSQFTRRPNRPERSYRVQRLTMEAQTISQRPAVVVVPLVGQGRKEAGSRLAMGEMHLQPFEAAVQCPPRRARYASSISLISVSVNAWTG